MYLLTFQVIFFLYFPLSGFFLFIFPHGLSCFSSFPRYGSFYYPPTPLDISTPFILFDTLLPPYLSHSLCPRWPSFRLVGHSIRGAEPVGSSGLLFRRAHCPAVTGREALEVQRRPRAWHTFRVGPEKAGC